MAAAIDAGHAVSGGSEVPGSEFIGKDLGLLAGRDALGETVKAGIGEAAMGADVWIDFTIPQATLTALALAPNAGVKPDVNARTEGHKRKILKKPLNGSPLLKPGISRAASIYLRPWSVRRPRVLDRTGILKCWKPITAARWMHHRGLL